MLRFRQGGSQFAIALLLFNAVALYYLYASKYEPDQTSSWFSKVRDSTHQQLKQAPLAQQQLITTVTATPAAITTVFVTPKPKTTTVTKSTTLTVTTVSRTTTTATLVQTQTVELAPKPLPSPERSGPGFCNICGPLDVYCHQYGCVSSVTSGNYGTVIDDNRQHNLARSRTYEGSNARFRRVLRKALAGDPIKIGVLGGSVTKGHGLTNHAHNWTAKLLQLLQELLPMSQIELVNGAVPATGSDYYSMCFGEHIPDDADIIIIELSVNDQRIESNAVAYEWLLRGLLELPKRPAILNIQVMALEFETITLGGDLQTPIAQFYDTPILNLRDMLLPHIFKNMPLEEHYFYIYPDKGIVDFRHVSVHGHTIMADLITAYTQRQLCAIEEEKTHPNKFVSKDGKLPNPDEMEDVPRLRLFEPYNRTKVNGKMTPQCQSVRTDKHPLVPIETKGWNLWVYEGNTEKPYLMADKPGDYAKFEVEVGVMGRVRITYLRSRTFKLGDVWCWLDDDRVSGTKVVSWWEHQQYNLARVMTITDKAAPGKHNLTCEILPETTDPDGGHQFRLIAVDAA